MSKNKKIVKVCSVFFVFVLATCSYPKRYMQKEENKISKCFDLWSYRDLEKEEKVFALLFIEKHQIALSTFANLLIGITESGDTSCFLDKNSNRKIMVGEKVIILPTKWDEMDKEIFQPTLRLFRDSHKNSLYCHVKTVYYGRFE